MLDSVTAPGDRRGGGTRKTDLPKALHERHTRKFGVESGGLLQPWKNEFRNGGDAISHSERLT